MMDDIRAGEIFKTRPFASLGEIKESFRREIQIWHPDKFANNPQHKEVAEEKTRKILAAYKHLSLLSAAALLSPSIGYALKTTHANPGLIPPTINGKIYVQTFDPARFFSFIETIDCWGLDKPEKVT